MSAALTAQPGLHRTATAVSTKAKVRGRNRKRKKSTMVDGACATISSRGRSYFINKGGINSSNEKVIRKKSNISIIR